MKKKKVFRIILFLLVLSVPVFWAVSAGMAKRTVSTEEPSLSSTLSQEEAPVNATFLQDVTLSGINYSENMSSDSADWDSKPYRFEIKELTEHGDQVDLTADLLFNQQKIAFIESSGYVFTTEAPLSRQREQVTVMLKTVKPDDIKIINFSFFFAPDSRWLDSVNQSKLGDNMTIEVALETKDDLLFFQDVVAPSEEISAIKSKAVFAVDASREEYLEFAQTCDNIGLVDEIESVDEWVQCSEFWPSRHPCIELPTYNGDKLDETSFAGN